MGQHCANNWDVYFIIYTMGVALSLIAVEPHKEDREVRIARVFFWPGFLVRGAYRGFKKS